MGRTKSTTSQRVFFKRETLRPKAMFSDPVTIKTILQPSVMISNHVPAQLNHCDIAQLQMILLYLHTPIHVYSQTHDY